MLVSTDTALRPWLFEANARALSASEYVMPPCAMEKPFSISFLTFIFSLQLPSPVSRTVIPSHWLNQSAAIISSTTSFPFKRLLISGGVTVYLKTFQANHG